MPANPPSSVGTAGNILLVEEYAALASAIGSALKKFAPAHRTDVVATLTAAEALAADTRPELLIVDFDPPQPQAVEFFSRLKSTLPDTRVLVIAAGISREVLAARGTRAAFSFVEKPFDLAAFGHAVQTSIQGSAGEAGEEAGGPIRNLGLGDILPLLCAAGATTVLKVDAAGGRNGEIHLAAGQIVHAVAAGQLGTQALEGMLSWSAPRLAETERSPESARTIQQPWPTVLAEVFRNAQALPRASVKPKAKAGASASLPAKKLVVIDDTDLLLVFVDEVLATADPTLEIVTAASGLAGATQVEATLPDVVLLDYSLPDITGDEVCQRLLGNENTARIPIIMMSGHVPEMAATAARRENVVATIAKPFLSHALIDLVRKTLARPLGPVRPPPARSESTPPQPAQQQAVAAAAPPPLNEKKRNGRAAATTAPPSPAPHTIARPEAVETSAEQIDPPVIAAKEPVAPPPLEQTKPVPQPPPAAVKPPEARLITPAPALLPAQAAPKAAFLPVLKATRQNSPPRSGDSKIVPFAQNLTAARISAASSNAVILGLALEVVSMQFSPSLQMAAIRGRPWSRTVTLHLHPQALPGVALPETGFELGRVDLDARGHMSIVRLTPTSSAVAKPPPRDAFPVADVGIMPVNGGEALQLTPAPGAPMTLQLFASFELAGVELSANFGVAALVLKSRDADLRVTLQPGGPATGATFKAAQVLLDHSARIAEILLDAVA